MIDLEQLKSAGYDIDPAIIEDMSEEEIGDFLRDVTYYRFAPGDKVQVDQQNLDKLIDMVASSGNSTAGLEVTKALGDTVLKIEGVVFASRHDVRYRLEGNNVLSEKFVKDSRPITFIDGVVLEYQNRLFAVPMDQQSSTPVALDAIEIIAGVGKPFVGFYGPSTLEELKAWLAEDGCETQASCGEFYLADNGFEGMSLHASPFAANASAEQRDVCIEMIERIWAMAPKLN